MADAVCGALQEALLLCEPCLTSGRSKNLASPSNMTEEVSSLLLPEFSAFKAEMVKWNKCMSLSSFKLRVGNKPSFISSCISKGMQLTLLRVFVPGCKEGIGSKCSAAKCPLVMFLFSLFAGVKCLYLAHLRLLSWKWFYWHIHSSAALFGTEGLEGRWSRKAEVCSKDSDIYNICSSAS